MRFSSHLHFRRRHHHQTRENRRQNSNADDAVSSVVNTLVNVVYVTASPTFDGPIGGYTTLGPVIQEPSSSNQQQQQQQSSSEAPQTTQQQPSSAAQQQTQQQSTSQQATSQTATSSSHLVPASFTSSAQQSATFLPSSTPKSVAIATSSTALSSSAAVSTFVPASSSIADGFAPPGNTVPSISSATATPEQTIKSSSGMSGGGKAGLTFGVILGLAAIAGLVFFCYRRRKQQMKRYKEMDDEKNFAGAPSPRNSIRGARAPSMKSVKAPSMAQSTRSVRTASTAPRLSLRPVTQFLPDITGKRKSMEPPLPGIAMVPPSPTRNLTPLPPGGSPWARGGSPWERRTNHSPSTSLSNPFSDPINPFGDAARSQSPIPAPLNVRTPQDAPAVTVTTPATNDAPAAGVAAGFMAGAALARAIRKNETPKPLNLEQSKPRAGSPLGISNDAMPSPSSEASGPVSTGTATVLAPGGAAGPGPSNVHRVQLDFVPSMDDELDLRAGQLVRLLHEYDDGWALCIRLDRSQQGVAPRTCLSARPVKPRPSGGPRGPPTRPNINGTPNGRMSPALGRPMSPAGGRNSPMGRPISPANGRNSPAMNGRNSPAMQNGPRRPMSPEEARAMSPGPFNRAPRPLSPGPFQPPPQQRRPPQGRSMSPGPYGGGPQFLPPPAVKQGRRRSNSAGAVQNMRNNPPGPSPLNLSSSPPNRKPVPGMAI